MIVVRGNYSAGDSSTDHQSRTARVAVPPGVVRHRLRAFLSADGVLTVEAPLVRGEVDAPRMLRSVDDDATPSGSRWKLAKSALQVITSDHKTTHAAAASENQLCNGNADTNDKVDDKDAEASGKSPPTSPAAAEQATSPAEGQAAGGTPAKEKVGVPIFRDELGTRRMYLAVELGTTYRPRDVVIQVSVGLSLSLRLKARTQRCN